jgi:SPP1 gp7 family putative phage head morphogenesis protein
VWELLDKAASRNEKSFVNTLKKFFTAQQNRIEKAIFKSFSKGPEEFDFDLSEDILEWANEDEELKKALKPEWLASMEEGSQTVNEIYNFEVEETLLNPKFISWVENEGAKQVKGINETTQVAIKDAVKEGIQDGEGIPKIKKRIEEVFANAKGYRAELIARTETHNSVGTGTYETYKSAGVEKKEWLSTSDSRTRDSHIKMNREVVGINDKFSNGLMFPGDANGQPEEICNCRCTLLPVIEE